MLKASNCVNNLFGKDRDAVVNALRLSMPKIVPDPLPTSKDQPTGVNNTEKQ